MSLLSKLKDRLKKYNEKTEWHYKIQHANAYFDDWAREFKVKDSLNYYIGRQWRNQGNYPNYEPYVVNMVYSTIKVKRPGLLFDNPIYHLLPKPSPDFAGFDFDAASKRALLKQDVLNDWVTNRKNFMAVETKAAIVDAFFGFGMIETGYSANWLENPDGYKPAYDNPDDPDEVTKKPDPVPEDEKVYIKRIPFPQFRVGGVDSPILERGNWCGYFEFVDPRDLANAPGYDYDPESYSGSRSTEVDSMQQGLFAGGKISEINEYLLKGNLVKIYRLWDWRNRHRIVYAEGQDKIVFADEFEKSPFSRLAFDENVYGFYPIPPVSQWLPSQDETNECSEQLRVHRRRSNRRYIVRADVDDLELQKVLNGPDGTYMKQEGTIADLIVEVPQAPMDQANAQAFLQSKDNFNLVSQTSSEMRGAVDRQTATAAAITNQASQMTEAEPKEIVANWLVDIGDNLLDNLATVIKPFWTKVSKPQQDLGTSVQQPQQYQQVSGQDIAGDDHDTQVLISSLSPVDNAVDLQNFNQFVTMLDSHPEFALSPIIIREIAVRCNYTNEAVIEEFQKMATLKLMGLQQQQGNGQQGGAPGAQQASNNMVQNSGPPPPAETAQQLQQGQ